jgi:TPR repeat protein
MLRCDNGWVNHLQPTAAHLATTLAVYFLLVAGTAHASLLDEAVTAHESGDYVHAGQLLLPLAEDGSAEAQFRLGTLHSLGQGMPVDQEVAARWFERAAKQGHHQAAVTLANMYLSGLGVPRDESAALAWFERAAAIAEEEEIEEEECG